MSVLIFSYKRVTFYQNLAANKPPSPKELAANKKSSKYWEYLNSKLYYTLLLAQFN